MGYPPLSPEETTDAETFALACQCGVYLNRLGYPVGEMEMIGLAELIMGTGPEPTADASSTRTRLEQTGEQ